MTGIRVLNNLFASRVSREAEETGAWAKRAAKWLSARNVLSFRESSKMINEFWLRHASLAISTRNIYRNAITFCCSSLSLGASDSLVRWEKEWKIGNRGFPRSQCVPVRSLCRALRRMFYAAETAIHRAAEMGNTRRTSHTHIHSRDSSTRERESRIRGERRETCVARIGCWIINEWSVRAVAWQPLCAALRQNGGTPALYVRRERTRSSPSAFPYAKPYQPPWASHSRVFVFSLGVKTHASRIILAAKSIYGSRGDDF